MFENLPETIPNKGKRKLRAIAASASVQAALVAGIIFIQMVMPEKLGEFQLLTTLYMAAPPPPPEVWVVRDSVQGRSGAAGGTLTPFDDAPTTRGGVIAAGFGR